MTKTKQALQLRQAQSYPVKRVVDYIASTWEKPVCLQDESFYRRTFEDYPKHLATAKCLGNYSLILADEADQLYGFIGLTPKNYYIEGKPLLGVEWTTWMISPQMRGKGFGLEMVLRMQKLFDVLYGMGATSSALSPYRLGGCQFMKAIPRFVKIYNLERVQTMAKISPLGVKMCQQFSRASETVPAWQECDQENVDRCADQLHAQYHGFSRRWIDVQWRYINHPIFRYHCCVVNPNSDRAVVVVLRIEKKETYTVAHLLDYFGYKSGYEDALAFIDHFCKQEMADFCHFFCTAPAVTAIMRANNWFSTLDDDEVQVPHLFNPLTLTSPATTNLIFASAKHLAALCDTASLYLTKADCDLDRPTFAQLISERSVQTAQGH